MTHHYQYDASLPHSRKKLNAAFVHRLKKLCARVYRLHVVETFGDEDYGDYVSVLTKRQDELDAILAIAKAYGFGDEYIFIFDEKEKGGKYIHIFLSKPNPSYNG